MLSTHLLLVVPAAALLVAAAAGTAGSAGTAGDPSHLAAAIPAAPSASAGQPVVRYRTAKVQGVSVFYREAGPADAPVVLLLHGFPSSSHMYRDLIPKLAHRYRVIAPDYPGFGQSEAPDRAAFAYTFDNLAKVTSGLLDQLDVKRFSVYLQDYGAPVGFRLMTDRPERVEAIIVQNAVAYDEGLGDGFGPIKALWQDRNPKTEQGIRDLLTPEFTRLQYTSGRADYRGSPDAWTVDQRFLDRPGNDMIQIDLQHDYRNNPPLYPKWQAFLRDRKPPTLVTWGKHDVLFTVKGALAFLRDVPDAQVHLLNAGHFALEEESDLIASLMLRFLDNHVPRPDRRADQPPSSR